MREYVSRRPSRYQRVPPARTGSRASAWSSRGAGDDGRHQDPAEPPRNGPLLSHPVVARLLTTVPEDHERAQVPPAMVHDVLASPGDPLSRSTREEMEARLGWDFSQVRVHADVAARASAAALDARAYTVGEHVVLGDGGADKRIVAHELTHVIQQCQGPVAGTNDGAGLRISDPSDRHERDAEASAVQVMQGPLSHAVQTVGDDGPGVDPGTGEHRALFAARSQVSTTANFDDLHRSRVLPKLRSRHPSDFMSSVGVQIQRAKFTLRAKATQDGKPKGTITSISDWPHRSGSNLRGHQGSHRTAYVVFENTIENRVINQTPAGAAGALAELVGEWSKLSGQTKETKDYWTRAENFFVGQEAMGQQADAAVIAEEIDNLLAARNLLVGTAGPGSLSGHGESDSSQRLQVIEKTIRKAGNKPPDFALEDEEKGATLTPQQRAQVAANDALRSAWRLLDYNPASLKQVEIESVLLTHYRSLRSAYRLTWDWLTDEGYLLKDYFLDHMGEVGMPLKRLIADKKISKKDISSIIDGVVNEISR
jgi:hypothetical protein